MSKPSKNVMRLPLEKRAEIAFKIAVAKAIDEHARLGLPIYIWRNGKVVGIFTERDLLNKLTGKTAPPPTVAVKELMSPNPEVLRETDSVATALNKMSMGHYRHIPVQNSDGTYCVTSIKHVLKYIARAEW